MILVSSKIKNSRWHQCALRKDVAMMAESELQPASRHEPSPGRGVEQLIDARACAGCAMRSRVVAGIDSLGLWCYTYKEEEPERNGQGVG